MSDFFGALVDFGSNLYQEQANKRQQEDQQQFNAAQASSARDFEERMSNTAIQRRSSDLQAAGFNPLMAVAQNGASSPVGHMATSGISNAGHFNSIGSSMASAAQAGLADSQKKVLDAQAIKTEAEAKEIGERTPTHAVSIETMKQNIEESKNRIQKIIQETSTSASSAANLEQQTRNLNELIPQIRATIDNLKASTRLHGAHTTLAGAQTQGTIAQTGKTVTETGEISQRIQAGLPALEGALKELQAAQKRAEMPGFHNDENAQRSASGAIGAALRAINPLSDFFKAR